MPFTEEDKILINSLLDLKGKKGKHLVTEFPRKKLERRPCLPVLFKSYGLLGGSTIVLVAADDTVPTQLIISILLTNWCYTKMAKRKIIFVHCI